MALTRTVRLRPEALTNWAASTALPLWQAIGVHRTTLHRVRTGETEPSTAFIAGALTALAPAKFEDLFEVVQHDAQ